MNGAKRHVKRMYRTMRYLLFTKNRGLLLKPTKIWDGRTSMKEFEFEIVGYSDSNFNTQADGKSVSGLLVTVNGAPVCKKCRKQRTVSLSVTEAEENASVEAAMEMVYVKNLLESVGLKVKLPMILYGDNRGQVDLANSWSVSGRTRHIKHAFLRELKEQGILEVKWLCGSRMTADVFTKNLPRADFEKHVNKFCGDDEYYKYDRDGLVKGESVGSGAELGLTAQSMSVETGERLREPVWSRSMGSGKIESANQERAGEAGLNLQSAGAEAELEREKREPGAVVGIDTAPDKRSGLVCSESTEVRREGTARGPSVEDLSVEGYEREYEEYNDRDE